MPIAVVVTRDDVGAPTTREIYARGERYRIGDGNLQILSADSRVLALYGSGNWLSAYVAGTVTVTAMGKDCSLAGPATADESPTDEATDTGPTDTGPTDTGPTATEPTAANPTAALPAAVSSTPAASSDASPDPRPANADGNPLTRPTGAEKDSARPGWMQPVVFRPRKLAPNRPAQDEPVAPSRMRTVAFRPKTFTRNDAGDPPAAGESGPRPVVFRRRTYRAVLIETEPSSTDAEPDADDN
jgi:hypothetical protein